MKTTVVSPSQLVVQVVLILSTLEATTTTSTITLTITMVDSELSVKVVANLAIWEAVVMVIWEAASMVIWEAASMAIWVAVIWVIWEAADVLEDHTVLSEAKYTLSTRQLITFSSVAFIYSGYSSCHLNFIVILYICYF